MTDITGTCSSRLQTQTTVSVQGQADHQVGLAVMVGMHKSPDPRWNNATMTYVGNADIVGGNGRQVGYFHNTHANGDTTHGTFEAKVSAEGTVVEGTWRLSKGTGTLANVSGGGAFKAQMTSATDSEMEWSGAYEL